ncbi:hypothetical protein EYC84_007071 [Monilinia fructicola]|uniref:Uncharacterized protein n=1 Tax=Monilinia fructicola TaxID=38448 RepID=A0A5M9K601_MONFR|nr:hypothetical protein EYC84_007071 [Monilinia fructicola]
MEEGNGKTPLSLAAKWGNIKVIKLLLEAGADIEGGEEDGQIPLLLAASFGRVDVVKLLLDCGADIKAKCPRGRTPLWYARNSWGVSEAVVELLLEKGALEI